MAMPGTSTRSESRLRYWVRVLRPLSWWFLLVLVLFAIRTHERWMERTRFIFTSAVAGQPDYSPPYATIDGKPIVSGERVSLGSHRFDLTHPKGVPYSTNLFVWYGGHDFGKVELARRKGTLVVTAEPPAARIAIRGPEFSVTLTNSAGISTSVPTDQYVVEARYQHWENTRLIYVSENVPNTLSIAPKFGALQLSCNQSEATFQLVRGDDEIMDAGAFPVTVPGLPPGTYSLVAWHHQHRWDVRPEVKSGFTNEIQVEFKYGSAVLETKPPGASVTGKDGHYWGTTPLQLSELQPGVWGFNLRLDNFEAVSALVSVVADTTNTVRTNLISQSFTGAMRAARQAMDTASYDSAIEFLGDALRANPDEPAASSLLREARGLRSIRLAETLGMNGDFIGGGMELQKALTCLPDNQQAKQMVADFRQHEPEQRERMRIERLEQGKKCFDSVLKRFSDSELFSGYEFKTTKPVMEVRRAIVEAMKGQNAFRYTADIWPTLETFQLEATQEFQTVLATSAGRRNVIIVGARVKDDETQILFKVLEYKTEAQIKFSIGNLIGAPVAVNYVPLHSSRVPNMSDKNRVQLIEGLSNVTASIQFALGQTNPPTVIK